MRTFHVYIIESPSPADLYHKRFEGEALNKTLQLSQIPSSHHITVDEIAFRAAFVVGLKEYFNSSSPAPSPIIHISAHGSDKGIQLTSGQVIQWDDLKQLLIPINEVVGGGLLLCMSSCKGFSSCVMAMDEEGKLPFGAVIGAVDQPTWGETNIAFATFYHLFATGNNIPDAVGVMKLASGSQNFLFTSGAVARNAYLRRLHSETAISTLQDNIAAVTDPNIKKFVK